MFTHVHTRTHARTRTHKGTYPHPLSDCRLHGARKADPSRLHSGRSWRRSAAGRERYGIRARRTAHDGGGGSELLMGDPGPPTMTTVAPPCRQTGSDDQPRGPAARPPSRLLAGLSRSNDTIQIQGGRVTLGARLPGRRRRHCRGRAAASAATMLRPYRCRLRFTPGRPAAVTAARKWFRNSAAGELGRLRDCRRRAGLPGPGARRAPPCRQRAGRRRDSLSGKGGSPPSRAADEARFRVVPGEPWRNPVGSASTLGS